MQADSGYSAELYQQLSAAPVVLLDGRATDSSEHAGFAALQAAGEVFAPQLSRPTVDFQHSKLAYCTG